MKTRRHFNLFLKLANMKEAKNIQGLCDVYHNLGINTL